MVCMWLSAQPGTSFASLKPVSSAVAKPFSWRRPSMVMACARVITAWGSKYTLPSAVPLPCMIPRAYMALAASSAQASIRLRSAKGTLRPL